MSKPRYDWWPYVKGMIRRYPELCEKERLLHEASIVQNVTGMPSGKGRVGDPTANAALKELPEVNQREMMAVREALEELGELLNGESRRKMVKMIFWDKTCTVYGAAEKLHHSERTVQQWHGDFIRAVANKYGLL